MSEFDYQQITDSLERLEIAADAAECHGAISAVVCMSGENGLPSWLDSHFPEIEPAIADGNALAGEAKRLLSDLYLHVAQQLQNGEFDYDLLMPDEDEGIDLRTQSLAHWCQGFLLGLRHSGVTDVGKFSGELAEILQDITDISQVSGEAMENTEEEEQSYTELVEYLRVGVMLFFETLQSQGTGNQTTTVH